MTHRHALLLVPALMLGLACDKASSVSGKLNGTWQCDVMTVSIDFAKGTYEGIAMGEQFTRKLTLVKEMGNSAIFKADEATITAQLQEDGSVMLTKEGGIPLVLKRAH